MSKFIAEKSFWELFPDAKLGIVLLNNYNNTSESPDELKKLLAESNELSKKYFPNEEFSENTVIKSYREAFKKFKIKKGARSSIEALLKRVKNGNPVSSINPLVDIYNAASLEFGLSCGAEDIDTFVGDLKLTITEGNDEFYLIGETEASPTLPGELCYKDNKGAVCRCLNWRDGARTMITNKTKNAFIILELLEPDRINDLENAVTKIAENSKKYLNAEIRTAILTKDNFEIEL